MATRPALAELASAISSRTRRGADCALQRRRGQQPTEADFRTLLDSPLARAVLGGVAAFGMQEMEEKETPGEQSGERPTG